MTAIKLDPYLNVDARTTDSRGEVRPCPATYCQTRSHDRPHFRRPRPAVIHGHVRFNPREMQVFVLNDGGEADFDLGNYERFLDINLRSDRQSAELHE